MLITLTTDFGEDSPYVAAVKGVILGINPNARIIDLSHQIAPQDLRHAAYFLSQSIPFFPAGVIHVVVVDPGVGSQRALLHVTVAGHSLLVPDNGCWTSLATQTSSPPSVIRLTEQGYWRQPVSATFHGRDILAPVAAHLSLGLDPRKLGPATTAWVNLEERPPVKRADGWVGEVVFVDHFGNLITNLPGERFIQQVHRPLRVRVAAHEVSRWVRTYAEAEPGSLVVLVSSAGTVEIAVVQGSAQQRLAVGVGARVEVLMSPDFPSAVSSGQLSYRRPEL